MGSRRLTALAAALLITLAPVAASPAFAESPVTLGSERVVDSSDVLGAADERDVEARLDALGADTDVDLWVVYVDEFDSPASAEGWANETAERNNLGTHQYLLAIATEGRSYYLSADTSGPLSESQIIAIERDTVEPLLAQDDWGGAAIAAADTLEDARSGGGGSGLWIIGLVALVGIGLIVWAVVRSRRKTGAATSGPAQVPLTELEKDAASALVRTDDALTRSRQELGFAKAEFGEEATREFEDAITEARASLDRAFAIQQQMDDETPDSTEQQRAWYLEIIDLCTKADASLDAKADAFDALRDLSQNAPEALARAQEAHTAATTQVAEAQARLAELTAAYSPGALRTVADNPDQAVARLAFASERLAQAQQAVQAGDGAGAAVAIRAAEQGIDQARLLEDAVETLGADLAAAERTAAVLLADLEKDLVAADATADPDGRLAPVVAATRHQVEAARTALTPPARDPIAAATALEQANTEIDAALGAIRDAQQRADRARSLLGQALLQAKTQVSAAENYITARCGTVGAPARTH
ncbi:TPM domain-containing protein, partial [Microbacterium sp.]|uniref:TPM domain-containing protein n=1 Tax=Microbacterium sp. TaxID=51671 RepID=UPI003734C58E